MRFTLLFSFILILISCNNRVQTPFDQDNLLLVQSDSFSSSTAGNLISTAIKEVHQLDAVLYPKILINPNKTSLFKTKANELEIEDILSLYPAFGTEDQFRVGSIKGKDLKKFLLNRTKEIYKVELEVAGLHYQFNFDGGRLISQAIEFTEDKNFDDNKVYNIAISNYFYFGYAFPSYKYRNSIGFVFNESHGFISAREALRTYLSSPHLFPMPNFSENRAAVTVDPNSFQIGFLPISKIQGDSFLSPYYGKIVTTEGIVTSKGINPWYPGGLEVYIQSLNPDSNENTSEGLKLLLDESEQVRIGDFVRVTGTVYEHGFTGLTITQLRNVSDFKILKNKVPLPEAIHLGEDGVRLPQRHFSRWVGNLNFKPFLDRSDALDLFESLEGMRVKIKNPQVVGFIGGQQDHPSFLQSSDKPYLTLFLRADSDRPHPQRSTGKGLIADEETDDFNPEIFSLTNNHMSPSIMSKEETKQIPVFNVGDLFDIDSNQSELEAILGFEQNIFGDGEYTLLPQNIDWDFVRQKQGTSLIPVSKRPATNLIANNNQLTIATINVENLSGAETERLSKVAEMLIENLKCPDFVTLVEIQDDNGVDFSGSSSAQITLKKLIQAFNNQKGSRSNHCKSMEYTSLNIDPIQNSEGGQPGGNIRVAQIFNKNKFQFKIKPMLNPNETTLFLPNGELSHNPGRINVNTDSFERTRRSIISQLYFKGQSYLFLGNHFNSKLGDSSHASVIQPVVFRSEERRRQLATDTNIFLKQVLHQQPNTKIVVAGDFNAYPNELSMKILAGKELVNLVNQDSLIKKSDRYTHIHNGNALAIDFIFTSHNMYNKKTKCDILHINTDFMGRLSDHDPVICLFED